MDYNYFDVLELSIDDIQDQDEATIKDSVNNAHTQQYALTIGAYANVPRSDGLTQAQWQKVLNDAKETLLDPGKRRKHIAALTQEPEELEQAVLTFPGGTEARNIADLAALLEQHATYAAEALYDGTLEQNLRSTDQNLFADAAQTIVDRFSDDHETGLLAMVAILRRKVKMQNGSEAGTPEQLARLIDKNWDQAKTLLYNGFFAVWLAHVEQQQLADTVKEITNRYADRQDIGLETFVQILDPSTGNPIPDISHPEIHLNAVDADSQQTIHFKIKNTERGFLYGDVQLKEDIPGLQISDTNIQGGGSVTLHLDGNALTSKHRTSLVIDTNGRHLEVPIYINHGIQPLLRWVCISGVLMAVLALSTRLFVSVLPIQWAGTFLFGIGIYAHWLLIVKKSFSWQRFLMPMMPIKNFFHSQHFSKLIEVLKRISKFAWGPIKWIGTQYVKYIKFCFRTILDIIKNMPGTQRYHFDNYIVDVKPNYLGCALVIFLILGSVVAIGYAIVVTGALILGAILAVVTFPFVVLASVATYVFMGLDKLFDLGFDLPLFVGWALWGLVIGLAIQGYRAIATYDQKRTKIWVAVAPVLLLCIMGTIRYISFVSASDAPSTKTAPIAAAQGTAGLETETITREAPDPGAIKQSPTESDAGSTPSEAPVSTLKQAAPAPLPPTTPSETPAGTPKQETPTVAPVPPIKQQVPTPLPPTTPGEPPVNPAAPETAAIPTLEPEPTTPSVRSAPAPIKQPATEPVRKSTEPREPVPPIKQQDTTPPTPTHPTPTQPKEATLVPPKQHIETPPPPEPEPIPPAVPSDMILIPEGEFQMGSNDNTDEKPIHTVYIDAFYIDTYEVTNAQYKVFVDANPQWRKDQISDAYHNGSYLKHWNGNNYPRDKGNHPVTFVSWYGAMAYAKWAGKRLPTEAEWEKAARGGKVGLKYPWGNTISSGQANYGNHVGGTTVVGHYAANGYGLYDMTGNVLEWCLDAYYGDFYASAPRRNPLGGVNTIENADLVISDFMRVESYRVVRSGAWYNTEAQNVRVAYRNRVTPTLTNVALGFRCVKAAAPLDRN